MFSVSVGYPLRQASLQSAVPALLQLASTGPALISLPHIAGNQELAAIARRGHRQPRVWLELTDTPDPHALVRVKANGSLSFKILFTGLGGVSLQVTCVNLAQTGAR